MFFGLNQRPFSKCKNEGRKSMQLTAVFMKVPEGYIAFVEELPGANTQGDTLEEARENLHEAVGLILESNRELAEKSLAGQIVTKEPFPLAVP
jgi:predicted RNase H-like HicB family nuclease